jgi:hypothetical protein
MSDSQGLADSGCRGICETDEGAALAAPGAGGWSKGCSPCPEKEGLIRGRELDHSPLRGRGAECGEDAAAHPEVCMPHMGPLNGLGHGQG